MKYGVDISEYDNKIDYDIFKQQIDFAIIRVGYGVQTSDNQIDKLLDEHYNNLKYDIPLGAYYYAYSTNYDQGRKEAENCIEYMAEKTFELPIFYDLEEERNTMEGARGFVDRIREQGLKAGIYCSTSFYKRKFEGIDCDCLWLAEYGSNTGEVPSQEPRYDYDIWQYSSLGTYDGWNRRGDVDLAKDYVIDGMTPTPVPPEPPAPPTPEGEIAEIQEWLNATYNTGIEVNDEWNDYTYSSLVSGLQIELNRQFGRNLSVDGIYGARTSDAYCTLRKGAKGNITRILQGILICKGYNQGGFDGIFGNGTEEALMNMQEDQELLVDGVCGRQSWDRLFDFR
jgi:GH25 family lysozyme M1 (1,4-beta-N-acetylmuramidase)